MMTADDIRNAFSVIEKAAGQLNDWESSFTDSVKKQWLNKGRLSGRQTMFLDRLAKKYHPDEIKNKERWVDSWDDAKKEVFEYVVRYYSTTSYFKNIVDKAKANDNYIPTEKVYKSITGNKWAKKVLNNRATAPLWNVGDFAKVRKSIGYNNLFKNPPNPLMPLEAYSAKIPRNIWDKDVLILEYLDRPSPHKHVYCCLVTDVTIRFVIQERHLKKSKL